MLMSVLGSKGKLVIRWMWLLFGCFVVSVHDEDDVGSILTLKCSTYGGIYQWKSILSRSTRRFSLPGFVLQEFQYFTLIWANEVKFSFQPFFFSRFCLFLYLCSPLAFPSLFLSLSVLRWFVACVCWQFQTVWFINTFSSDFNSYQLFKLFQYDF